MEQKVTTPVVKGLILSLILIVYSLILQFSGQMMNKGLGYLQYLIIFGGIIYACIMYAKQMNHNVTFGNVFGHGFKMTTVVTVIMVVYTIIAIKFLFPEMAEMALEQTTIELDKQELSDDQKDQALEMTRKFFFPFAIAGVLFVFMIAGTIASLIGAAVAKKNPVSPFNNTTVNT